MVETVAESLRQKGGTKARRGPVSLGDSAMGGIQGNLLQARGKTRAGRTSFVLQQREVHRVTSSGPEARVKDSYQI